MNASLFLNVSEQQQLPILLFFPAIGIPHTFESMHFLSYPSGFYLIFTEASLSSLLSSFACSIPLCVKIIAIAANGELGVFEGRTVALIHPIVMGGLYFFTLWAGYLGWQWRRVRTIQEDINELKKQLKASSSSSTTDESSSDSPIEAQIEKLTEERKELLKGSFRDRHYNAGSILLGFGVIEAIGGGLDTWFRTGQLFPGPHLFGGAAITALWAAAAALAPAMQKGNETARNAHIALNVLNVLLFTSQIPTGFEILSSVFEYTTWP
ncbi:hypothetical protein Syun_019861 [Stephania yunnanensis]|uniref:Uncharacterized protein n=1 Tax=Stephania yunnanensis TaxID=152371 RepID=A0AAP0NXS1_9MAGN